MAGFDESSGESFSDVNSGDAQADFSDVQAGSSSTAPAAGSGTTYTVKSGDNLRKIAQRFYGDEMQWHKIRDANREKLPNPDRIQVGMQLVIPDA
jgi:nucleoid-associated protein YgaU